jgi:hypothetical protein
MERKGKQIEKERQSSKGKRKIGMKTKREKDKRIK